MVVTLRSKGFVVDDVVVASVGENYVLIPTAIADGKTSHIISVDLADVGYMDVQFVGEKWWHGLSGFGLGRWHKD